MVSSMRTLRALALVAFTAAPVAGGDVWFYVNYNCPFANAFQALPVNDCEGQCNTLKSGAAAVGIATRGLTCSIYNSHDCTGDYQSVGIELGIAFGCTNSHVGWINSVKCYIGC